LNKRRAGKVKCPVHKMLKKDIIWLFDHHCKHGHSYAEHYACFLAENPKDSPFRERVGVFDIETTGLKANWSHLLCWCIKEQGTDIIHKDLATRKEVRNKDDKRIIKSAIKEIQNYDRIIGWYSSRFDLPYVRSRAIFHGIDFPSYKELCQTDVYYIARNKLALHSNRLGAVCEFFGIVAKNHPMSPGLWIRAGRGDKDALEEVLTHCEEDVVSTDKCHIMLSKYSAETKRSI